MYMYMYMYIGFHAKEEGERGENFRGENFGGRGYQQQLIQYRYNVHQKGVVSVSGTHCLLGG